MKFIALVLIFLAPTAFGASLIELNETVEVAPHSELKLIQLVDLEKSQGLQAIRSRLENASVMKIQEAGERVELSLQSVAEYLKMALSTQERQEFKFSIPRKIVIQVQTPKLTEEEVRKRLIGSWSAQCAECRIEITDLRLPMGDFKQWEIVVPSTLPKGSFNVPLQVKNQKGQDARFWIQGKVDLFKEVPVAQRALYMGERLQAQDFRYEWRSITHAVDGSPAKNLMIGMMVKMPISVDQVIWSRNLEREKALRKGDQVRVFSSGGLWELSLPAVADRDADIGDTVTLKNPSTKKSLVGLVVGKGEVEIK